MSIRIGVVGGTGLVGGTFIELLSRGAYAEMVEIIPFASEAGKKIALPVGELETQVLSEEIVSTLHLMMFGCASAISERWVPIALSHGVYCLDNSAAYRMDPTVPLVVPEVNGNLITPEQKLYANPNCCVALLAVVLGPIHQHFTVEEVVVDTYQSVSGAGKNGIEVLRSELRAREQGQEPPVSTLFREPCLFNVFPHQSSEDPETGYNDEESKVVQEIQKIIDPKMRVLPTCNRIATLRSHGEAVTLSLQKDVSVMEIEALLARAPGVRLTEKAPTALRGSHQTEVLVGRIRQPYPHRIQLWLCGDQLLKGAAWNAYQIMARLLQVTPLNLLRQEARRKLAQQSLETIPELPEESESPEPIELTEGSVEAEEAEEEPEHESDPEKQSWNQLVESR